MHWDENIVNIIFFSRLNQNDTSVFDTLSVMLSLEENSTINDFENPQSLQLTNQTNQKITLPQKENVTNLTRKHRTITNENHHRKRSQSSRVAADHDNYVLEETSWVCQLVPITSGAFLLEVTVERFRRIRFHASSTSYERRQDLLACGWKCANLYPDFRKTIRETVGVHFDWN